MTVWRQDSVLGGPYEAADLDGTGAVLVRRLAGTGRAALYIHGYNDYFFQRELAETFGAHGYDFYALDLHGYGRSTRGPRFYCADLDDYHPDVEAAFTTIGTDEVLLAGHSTGALIAVSWGRHNQDRVERFVLTSPYLAPLVPPVLLRALAPVLRRIVRRRPTARLPIRLPGRNSRSLHKKYGGLWEFDEQWKLTSHRTPQIAWLLAVDRAQRALGTLRRPVLVLISARSSRRRRHLGSVDAVLDVRAIARAARRLGPDVRIVPIAGARHDIFLSSDGPRSEARRQLGRWLGGEPVGEADWLVAEPIAHRGRYDEQHPENSLAAFAHAVETGTPIELDVQLTRDGELAVVHDDRLGERLISDLTAADVAASGLPTLDEALAAVRGRVPVLVDVRRWRPGLKPALEQAVVRSLRGYDGPVAVQSFDPVVLMRLRKALPGVQLGQACGLLHSAGPVAGAVGRSMITNWVTRPDFITYELDALPNRQAAFWRRRGAPIIAWTVTSPQEAAKARRYADNFIFSGYSPS